MASIVPSSQDWHGDRGASFAARGDRPWRVEPLLAGLALGVVERLGGDALLVDADDNRLRKSRMVRINDIVLVDQPRLPRRAASTVISSRERAFKFDPTRLLYSLQWQHKATPPDFLLVLVRDPRQWFDAVAVQLLGELE